MRPFVLFSALLLFVSISFAGNVAGDSELTLYEKLCDVNAQWLTKDHSAPAFSNKVIFEHDEALIQTHLMLVEQTLRNADVSHLTAAHQANRSHYLDILHDYWMAGRFPKNLYHKERTPYFIDDYGTACAVGHLILHSDYAALSHRISKENNYAYVKDLLVYDDLIEWANEAGFTVDELAWIQPGYAWPAEYNWSSVGQGTNGQVTTSVKDVDNNIIYFGGNYTSADNLPNINSVVAYDGGSFTSLGDGLDGTVNALQLHDGKLYAVGTFTASGNTPLGPVAVWDGNTWQDVSNGIYGGTAYDLEVFNGQLYAAGDFVMGIINVPDVHLAVYKNGVWTLAGDQADSTAHDLAVGDSVLYVGGVFDAVGLDIANGVYGWNGKDVVLLDNYMRDMKVDELEVYMDTLVVAGSVLDTSGWRTDVLRWLGDEWKSWLGNYDIIDTNGGPSRIGVIYPDTSKVYGMSAIGNKLYISGDFSFSTPGSWGISYVTYGENVAEVTYKEVNGIYYYDSDALAAVVDGPVYTCQPFNNDLIMGGAFSQITVKPNFSTDIEVTAHTLAKTDFTVSVKDQPYASTLKVLNSLTSNQAYIELDNTNSQALHLTLHSTDGKQVRQVEVNDGTGRIAIPKGELSSGLYLFSLYNGQQLLGRGKVVFQ